jgi:hypothetical protein
MLTINEFNQIKASLKVMGGALLNDVHHIPEINVVYVLQEFTQQEHGIKTISIPCRETK